MHDVAFDGLTDWENYLPLLDECALTSCCVLRTGNLPSPSFFGSSCLCHCLCSPEWFHGCYLCDWHCSDCWYPISLMQGRLLLQVADENLHQDWGFDSDLLHDSWKHETIWIDWCSSLQHLSSLTVKTRFISLGLRQEAVSSASYCHALSDGPDILNSGCHLPLEFNQNYHLELCHQSVAGLGWGQIEHMNS